MDSVQPNSPTPKAQRLRQVRLVRGRHAWSFVCAPGEEAQLLREASGLVGALAADLRRLDLLILARELGVDLKSLKQAVRKAD